MDPGAGALSVLAWVYGLVVRGRNALYDRGWLRSYRAEVPVVCVGNIVCGGTGKTPTVMAVVGMLEEQGHRPGVLTRGYKGSARRPADEVLLYGNAMPGVPVVVGGDRVASARRAVKEYDVDVLVMDDGFGHRRLARDLDIVLLGEPLEKIRLLPGGLYREPASSLARADVIIKTYEQAEDSQHNWARREPVALVSSKKQMSLKQLHSKRVLAFCGIGNPPSFERTLITAGAKVVEMIDYPDHYRYMRGDLEKLAELGRQLECDLAVTTMKDWVKIEYDGLTWPSDDCRLWALDIEMKFSEATGQLLEKKLAGLFASEAIHDG